MQLVHPMGNNPSVVVTSPMGHRSIPGVLSGKVHFHNGPDFAATWPLQTEGLPVYAAAAGTVQSIGYDATNGNFVILSHAGGYTTSYLHLKSKPFLRKDARVHAGQQIGRVGSTGMVTGAHLHFILRKNGTPIDPLPLINKNLPILAMRQVAKHWWVGVGAFLIVTGFGLNRRRKRIERY